MDKADHYFDQLAVTFNQQIYQSHKGQLRLMTQQRAILNYILKPSSVPLHFVDLGAGAGQICQWLASLGQTVSYVEPSDAMFSQGESLLQPMGVYCHQQSYQQWMRSQSQPVDVLMFNAVIEWLEQPKQALELARNFLKPGGYLVLMSYNRDALRMRRLMRGHWQQALADIPGDGTGLTPISLFSALDAKNWLEELGYHILDWRGVRTVTDWLPGQHELQELIELDQQLQTQDPWRQLGRYQHFVAQYWH